MTSFQSRMVSNLFESFGYGEFNLFDVSSVMETTVGNVKITVDKLVKTQVLINHDNGFFSIKGVES